MNSVSHGLTSGEAIEGLLTLAKVRGTILDVTFGSGVFWKGSPRVVYGCDINPERAKDLVADFRHLPFRDAEYRTVVFDPPFHPFVNSAEQARFHGMGNNEKELKTDFQLGVKECWRVAQCHLIVKCQGFVHNHTPQWMPLWAIEICGEPFEWLIVSRDGKRVSGRWTSTLSLRRNHADYLLFSKLGNKR
jgi:hypothetical protein